MDFPFISPHIRYTDSGNIFSQSLILFHTLQKKQKGMLCIFGDEAFLKKFLQIAQEQHFRFRTIQYYEDLKLLAQGGKEIFLLSEEQLSLSLSLGEIEKEIHFKKGIILASEDMSKKLIDLGYEYSEYQKRGTFFKKGDICHIFLENNESIRVSFWGDEIEDIFYKDTTLEHFSLFSRKRIQEKIPGKSILLSEYLQKSGCHIHLIGMEFQESSALIYSHFPLVSSFEMLAAESVGNIKKESLYIKDIECNSIEHFRDFLQSGKKVYLYTRYQETLERFLQDNHLGENITLKNIKSQLYKSFQSPTELYFGDDILGSIFVKKRLKKKLSQDLDLLLKIQTGDYVVHIDHGIGVFHAVVKRDLAGIEKEYIEIHYKNEEKLFVPLTELARVSKYIGSEHPELTGLSGKLWERKIKKIREDIQEIAEELLKNFAERKSRSGEENIFQKKEMDLFRQSFPYVLTHDQDAALEEIFADMCSHKNMDRLLVGDVGFGKTEVAFQAAYLALLNKKQVVLVSPLVVLAHEHYSKAQERFRSFGIEVGILTRLQSQAEVTRTLKGVQNGSIHLLIGTHRILSEKIQYKNLGLLIVDEEHKFGVTDKEKIKHIKSQIDILSLSATPIPRSLNLALSGVRDISLLKTPPVGRKSIQTLVSQWNEALIQQAGEREFERGGQIFFVHNRVANLEVLQKQLLILFPKKKIVITHGQLPGDELEDRILAFKKREYDILLSTTVIENGIDFSNVNTIFINECQSFGISQIHQLRGRVGRSDAQGYCYLLYKKETLDIEAAKRIKTIVDYSYLGAGFELAMKDLEIRGGGDILGIRQSGQAHEIGISLFLKMLEEKIEDLRNTEAGKKPEGKNRETKIDLGIDITLPDSYFLTESDKLEFYREIEMITDMDDLLLLKESFMEEKQEIHPHVESLFHLIECRLLAQKMKIVQIKKVGLNYQIDFHESLILEDLKAFLALDSETKFQVIEIHKIRASIKGFENDTFFIQYLVQLLRGNVRSTKIRLVKRENA